MMDTARTTEVETGFGKLSFREIVENRQKRWVSLKKNPFTELSQTIDIPSLISKNLMSLVLDNLPSYIPPELRQRLKETHPNPIISTGLLVDQRVFHNDKGTKPSFLVPKNIDGKDKPSYERGLELLDEIANDTLAQEILHQLGSKYKWFKPVSAVLENRNPIRSGYKSGLEEIENDFGSKKEFELFRKKLVLAMLTGKNDEVDIHLMTLRHRYKSIDEFAIKIGEAAEYSDTLMKVLKKNGQRKTHVFFCGSVGKLCLSRNYRHTLTSNDTSGRKCDFILYPG